MSKSKSVSSAISIPVFVQEHELVRPSTKFGKRAAEAVYTTLGSISLDSKSLNACLDSGAALLAAGRERLAEMPNVALDTLTFELAVTGSGEVGFLGTGVGVELQATLSITLKVT